MRQVLLVLAFLPALWLASFAVVQAHGPLYRPPAFYGGAGYYYGAPFRPGRFYYAPRRGYDYHYFRMTPGYYGYSYSWFRGPGGYYCYPRR